MHGVGEFLRNLAVVLCVAAVTTVIFQRLRQPVVFGYLLAGLIIGPHIPIPLVVDAETVHTLAELGVILLMFGLGLEFNLRKLAQVGPTAGVIAVAQSSLMVALGYATAQLFGWTPLESFYAGAAIAISSTTIIVRAFAEQKVQGRFTEIVFGVLIIEDLIAIFLLAILTTVSSGGTISASALGLTAGRLAMFLAALLGVGLLVVPRFVRFVVKLERPETTVVAVIGICFACALLALEFGYSVALGAFIAGSLVAESGREQVIEHLVQPVRDIFAAIFFVAVGMLIEPAVVAEHWRPVIVLTLVVIVGKVASVTIASFLMGFGVRTSVQTGMSLAQIGEFSFIIAGVGLASGATRPFLYPIAIAVSALTTLTTPILIRAARPMANYVDRHLPPSLQTFATLYGSWLERLRSTPDVPQKRSHLRTSLRFMLLDAVLLAALVIGTSLELERVTAMLRRWVNLSPDVARLALIGGALIVATPLTVGVLRNAKRYGSALAERALPVPLSGPDLAAAPRTVLRITLQFALIALIGVLLIAITQPFVPLLRGVAVLAVIMTALGIIFWRSAANLHGHTRAGAQVIAAALARQMTSDAEHRTRRDDESSALQWARQALPGLGEPEALRLDQAAFCVERTLTSINLRGRTGASVIAIRRNDADVLVPTGHEVLRAGDVLALAGSREAIASAIRLLEHGEAE
jgi:CPA2 family monovalent cation:H+ antiporter-2